jgi:NAD/NADP transhydrogenase alpha subunit
MQVNYTKNLWNYLQILLKKEENNIYIDINSKDEIIEKTLLTKQGKIIQEF